MRYAPTWAVCDIQISDKYPCARYGFNSYHLSDDLNSSKGILRDRVVWNYLISEITYFQGRLLLPCAIIVETMCTSSTENGVSREGVREDSLHKDTKNFSIGKEQLTMDNGQLADYFSTVCFKPLKHRYLHGRAAICIGAVHIDAWCIHYSCICKNLQL